MCVVLFLDRRPHTYDFFHSDAAKSSFAIPAFTSSTNINMCTVTFRRVIPALMLPTGIGQKSPHRKKT